MEHYAIKTKGLTRHFGSIKAVNGIDLNVPGGRSLRFPRAKRRGQDDHHPHAAGAQLRHTDRGRRAQRH